MSRYYEFISSCDGEFIREIHGINPPEKFRNRVNKSSTLEQLKKEDNKFINGAEPHNPEGTQ